jgi:periplasmic protein TonB
MTSNTNHPRSFDDILFEHRNKSYGAYAIRTGYNARMLTALGAGLSVLLLGAFIFMNRENTNGLVPVVDREEGLLVRTIELPVEKPVEPEKPKEARPQKPVEKTATVKYVSNIKIEKEVKETMVAVDDLDGKAIGDKQQDGKVADGTVLSDPEPEVSGNGTGEAAPVQPDFNAVEKGPEFPGGVIALKKFLSRNLVSPDNLERGELKTVRVRFKVDKDGSVSSLEILNSAGDDFDDEVVRVCRRMPKWIPALQNGVHVPVSYVLPVTFMGSE